MYYIEIYGIGIANKLNKTWHLVSGICFLNRLKEKLKKSDYKVQLTNNSKNRFLRMLPITYVWINLQGKITKADYKKLENEISRCLIISIEKPSQILIEKRS